MIKPLLSYDRKTRFLFLNGLISLLVLITISSIPEKELPVPPQEFREAAKIMKKSIEVFSTHCRKNDFNMDELIDPAKTGLIGNELTEITTTIGHLGAKRTTINPNFASLIVSLLMEAGVKENDTIAIACSGSFPALLIASLSATEAMKVNPRVILSIGASSYGATNINFTLLDIHELMHQHGLIDTKPIAVSPGGIDDIGSEFDRELVKMVQSKTESYGIPFIYDGDLQSNVRLRESLYFTDKNIGIKAFINIGGGYANMGTSQQILTLPPGLIMEAPLPEQSSRGVIYSMLGKGIPVIHLLFIKGIAQKYNLTWDPVSVPEYQDRLYNRDDSISATMKFPGILYLGYFFFILVYYNRLQNMN
jgi:poly-gamma-glutamate system protein